MPKIQMFTWGYWGWGNETKSLIKAVDAVEDERGFGPPLFVDIRISRSVRAKGFSGNSFGDLVGSDRYRWLPQLGNDAIMTGGVRIKIHDPAAAADLLDLAIEARRNRRRILFFCACEIPGRCHRSVVADLLLANAKRRRLPFMADEWPGGDPGTLTVTVPEPLRKQVSRGRKSIPLGNTFKLVEFARLPRGSAVEVRSPEGSVWVVSGPVQKSAGGWCLPVFGEQVFAGCEAALRAGRDYRRENGYGQRTVC